MLLFLISYVGFEKCLAENAEKGDGKDAWSHFILYFFRNQLSLLGKQLLADSQTENLSKLYYNFIQFSNTREIYKQKLFLKRIKKVAVVSFHKKIIIIKLINNLK